MKLSKGKLLSALRKWYQAWNEHNLDEVMTLFHEEVLFIHWSGQTIKGKQLLHKAWIPWFKNHGNFIFNESETFIDENEQKALFHWELRWPSIENGYLGQFEKREGVDVIHFKDGKIIKKLSFSKTIIEIKNKKVKLLPKKLPT